MNRFAFKKATATEPGRHLEIIRRTQVQNSRKLRRRAKIASNTRVAFQGERGAFSEEAAVKLLGSEVSLVPLPTFDAAFGAIAQGTADYILAPIENSLAGPVQRSLDLLVESELTIVGEVIIRVQHNLIGPPGAI